MTNDLNIARFKMYLKNETREILLYFTEKDFSFMLF